MHTHCSPAFESIGLSFSLFLFCYQRASMFGSWAQAAFVASLSLSGQNRSSAHRSFALSLLGSFVRPTDQTAVNYCLSSQSAFLSLSLSLVFFPRCRLFRLVETTFLFPRLRWRLCFRCWLSVHDCCSLACFILSQPQRRKPFTTLCKHRLHFLYSLFPFQLHFYFGKTIPTPRAATSPTATAAAAAAAAVSASASATARPSHHLLVGCSSFSSDIGSSVLSVFWCVCAVYCLLPLLYNCRLSPRQVARQRQCIHWLLVFGWRHCRWCTCVVVNYTHSTILLGDLLWSVIHSNSSQTHILHKDNVSSPPPPPPSADGLQKFKKFRCAPLVFKVKVFFSDESTGTVWHMHT